MTCQSEVFDKMLTGDTQEAQTKVIEMKDVSENAIETLIRWLYLGEIESDDDVRGLFFLADKYFIENLKVNLFLISKFF